MRVFSLILVSLIIMSAPALSQQSHRAFPPPLKGTFDPSLLEIVKSRANPLVPEPPAPTSAGVDHTGTPRLTNGLRGWPDSTDFNDTSPFLYGDNYVIHIYVHDGGGSWTTSSLNPFDLTRDSEAANVRAATEWIEGKAPDRASLSFNTSNTTTYYYYNVSIPATIGENSKDEWMKNEAPDSIGFWDADGDGEILDDMLEYLRTLDGGGWENVIAVFHLNHEGRSYAYDEISATACFSRNAVGGVTIRAIPRTYAHEIMHLYGASDEYLNGFYTGYCEHGDCDTDYENIWITPVYKNGNCASCGYDFSCLMRWMADNILNRYVSLCPYTVGHVGWGDGDSDGVLDLEESSPWADYNTPVSGSSLKTKDSTFAASGTAYVAYRFTYVSAVQYSIDGGAWKNATPSDGWFNGLKERFHFGDTLRKEGSHTIRIRAQSGDWNYQASPPEYFKLRLDRTGPDAPTLSTSTHSDTSKWYGERSCTFTWKTPFDSTGVDGYSYAFDQNPGTVPTPTIQTTVRKASGTATATGRWYMHVRAVDVLGNWGQTAHYLAKIDMTPPSKPDVASSTHFPSLYSNKKVATFLWSSTDGESGLAGYNYQGYLDQDPDADVSTDPDQTSSEDSLDLDVPTPPDGPYYFHVRAVDNVGNWGPVAHYKILADMTPPIITVSSSTHPDPEAWYASGDVTFSWQETADDSAGIAGYSYVETLGVDLVTPDDSIDILEKSLDFSDLESGYHYFSVQARDNAGNWGSAIMGGMGIARVMARIDRTPPDTVTNLHTHSHYKAIGKWDCRQSADKTVDVDWDKALDAHSRVGGYAVVWNHSRTTWPPLYASLDSMAQSTTSGLLGDADDWYFHIRTVDKVGNWSDSMATIGPFFIRTAPPSAPEPLAATTGDASVTMRWRPVSGVPDVTYKLYRRIKGGTYGSAVATGITDTTYTESYPAVENGDTYYYVVTSVDSCGKESEHSYETLAEPEYTTPNTGVHWHLSTLADSSKGGIRPSGAQYTLHGTVTVSPNDTIEVDAGKTLTSQDDSGTKKLHVEGTLIAVGTTASPIFFTAAAKAGSWGGIELENPGAGSIIDHCFVRFAVTGITWGGGSPKVTNSIIEWNSMGGVVASPAPAATCIIDTNIVQRCGGTGISIFASPNSTSRAAKNTVRNNGSGILYDMNVLLPGPTSLTVNNNDVRNQTGDGIMCGNGAINTFVTANTVLENQNGIVFEGEGWLVAAPIVSGNQLSGNRNAGIYTAMQSAPVVQNNTIVQNGFSGCYSKTDAHPSCSGNTITGSLYGVYVTNSPAAVPDFGNPGPGSAGMNRLDGHKLFWMWNGGGVVMNAKNNWWGSAQANPQLVIGGPSAVLWNPVWNVVNQPPVITLLTPNGGSAQDTVVITWNDFDPDPADNAKINLYYDTDPVGLDGTQIAGASNISEDDETDRFDWDTRLIPRGTYFVYALISDNAATSAGYSPGSVTIEHADISITPDSLYAVVEPGATRLDTLTIENSGTDTLHASLRSNATWLVLGDTTATVPESESAVVTFTWDATTLSDGSLDSTSIDVESDDHVDSLVTIPALIHVEKGSVGVSDSAIAFGGIPVDSTSTDTLEVYNTGSADLYVTGATTDVPFSIVGATFPDTLAAGDTLILSVRYGPTAPGADADTLTVSTSDSGEPKVDIPLTGIGLGPEVRLTSASHDLGTVAVGSSGTWGVHVANDGTADLVVSSAAFDSKGFSLESPPLATSVLAGDSVLVTIGFNPAEARAYRDTLRLATNDPDEEELVVDLTGTGALPEAELSVESISFGGVAVGDSTSSSVWVRNVGQDTLTLTSAVAAAPFAVVSPALPASVLAGDSLEVSIRFRPASLDSVSDTLYVQTDAPTTSVLDAALSGWGLAPVIVLVDSLLDFGAVHADSSDTLLYAVTNDGTAELSISSLSLSVGARFALVAQSMPVVVAPADTHLFAAVFLPSPVGAHTDTVAIASNDPVSPVATMRLHAVAVAPEAGIYRITTAGGDIFEHDLLPEGFDFGSAILGEKKYAFFRLRNNGGYPLRLSSLSVSPSAFAFGDTLSLPITIAPGDYQPISVSYLTDSLISHGGHLAIGTNDRETPAIDVPLAGHGALAVAGLYPSAINQIVFEEESMELSISLTNSGENYYGYIIKAREPSFVAAPADALSVVDRDAAAPATAPPAAPANLADWKERQRSAAGAPAVQTHAANMPGGGPVPTVDASAAASSAAFLLSGGIEWLTPVDSLGVIPPNDTVNAAVSLDAAPVAAGVHDAELLVLTENAGMDTTLVPVRMRVPRMRYADHTAAFRATVTDEGAFGFHDSGQAFSFGSGFIYPSPGGESLLFHGSLWVGTDTLHVSDESYGYDFEVMPGGKLTIGGTDPQRSLARFTDSGAPSGLDVEVGQECLSYPDPAHDDFLVVNYTIENVSGAALSHVYAAIWLDWDVGLYNKDRGGFNAGTETGYMWNAETPGLPYAGITILSPLSCASFRLIYNPTYLYPYGTIRDRDKYLLMSSGAVDTATAVTQDWSMVMSAGPFTVAAGDSVRVSFAIVGGSTLAALLDHAAEARDLWGTPVEPTPPAPRLALEQCYPNPFNPSTRIAFETPRPGRVQLTVFNIAGQVVARLIDRPMPAGRYVVTWDGRTTLGHTAASGVYFYRLSAEGCAGLTRKMVLLR